MLTRSLQSATIIPSPPAPGTLSPTRHILLLQGLMGPLFRCLGQELKRTGHQVYKVNFNGGDRLFWRLPNGIDYRGTLQDWPSTLRGILQKHQITDVVLFGDCRDHHMLAIPVCRDAGIPVHVFEEGYIRPDWVTLELGGVNGHSSLPKDPQWYIDTATTLPTPVSYPSVTSSFARRAWEAIAYNTADVLTRWHYKHWNNHRPWHPLVEAVGWMRKLRRRKEARISSFQIIERLEQAQTPYFLFPLQLDSDAQIRLHSPFAGIADAIRIVIASFAQHAPANVRLVIKEHPLDNGVRDWQQTTMDMAHLFGVENRVDYIAFGDITPITQSALGMVTINSTSGTLALAIGRAVKTLGHAVYDMPEVTHQGSLNSFWPSPLPPDREVFEAFRRVLLDRCLIPGGFFSEEALASAVRHAALRITGER